MKRTNTLCALILLLVTNFSTFAGVTDGDVTAYRLQPSQNSVLFTDNSSHDPGSFIAPLGAAFLSGTSCHGSLSGTAGVNGLLCSGTAGNPIGTYSCVVSNGTPNASDTTWCLFSENPRTGDKAWAVKYVDGDIPTNDGASIVRCEGTDIFDPENGCRTPPSQISVEGGFIKLDIMVGSAPLNADCSVTAHNGRMVFNNGGGQIYICRTGVWETITLD